jgi:hypothetical protein
MQLDADAAKRYLASVPLATRCGGRGRGRRPAPHRLAPACAGAAAGRSRWRRGRGGAQCRAARRRGGARPARPARRAASRDAGAAPARPMRAAAPRRAKTRAATVQSPPNPPARPARAVTALLAALYVVSLLARTAWRGLCMSPVLAVRKLQGAAAGRGTFQGLGKASARSGGRRGSGEGQALPPAARRAAARPQPTTAHTAPPPPFAVWRLVTGHLWHAGLLHIVFNLAAFVPIGSGLERGMGSVRVRRRALRAGREVGRRGSLRQPPRGASPRCGQSPHLAHHNPSPHPLNPPAPSLPTSWACSCWCRTPSSSASPTA